MNSVLSIVISLAALAAGGIALFELRMIGFPDGYVSEWDQIRRILLTLFAGISVLVAGLSVLLGLMSKAATRKGIAIFGALYAALTIATAVADAYLRSISGRGG